MPVNATDYDRGDELIEKLKEYDEQAGALVYAAGEPDNIVGVYCPNPLDAQAAANAVDGVELVSFEDKLAKFDMEADAIGSASAESIAAEAATDDEDTFTKAKRVAERHEDTVGGFIEAVGEYDVCVQSHDTSAGYEIAADVDGLRFKEHRSGLLYFDLEAVQPFEEYLCDEFYASVKTDDLRYPSEADAALRFPTTVGYTAGRTIDADDRAHQTYIELVDDSQIEIGLLDAEQNDMDEANERAGL